MDPTMIAAMASQSGAQRANFFNFLSSQLTGYQERKFTEKMYDKSINDQERLWMMNNDYNSPKAQRARLEEAGFNPALMYGKSGSTGNSGSPASGGQLSQSSFPTFQFERGLGVLEKMYDIQAKKAQADILKGDARIKDIDASMYENFEADGTLVRGKRGEYNKKIYEGSLKGKENRYMENYLKERNNKLRMESELRKMEYEFFKANKAFRYLGILGNIMRK